MDITSQIYIRVMMIICRLTNSNLTPLLRQHNLNPQDWWVLHSQYLLRLLCGYSTSWQCITFIGYKPCRVSHTGRKPSTRPSISPVSVAQLVEHLLHYLAVVGLSPTCDRIFNMLVTTSACVVGVKISYFGFGWKGNSNTAEPYYLYI